MMRIHFEELAAPQRAGGIDTAVRGLRENLRKEGITVSRSSEFPRVEEPPDCIHFHGIWSPSLAWRLWLWRKRGVPCVVSAHGMLEPWALEHKRGKKMLGWFIYQKHVLNLASALHATSSREAENLRRLGVCGKIETIPWGIDIPVRHSENCGLASKGELRKALFVGRIYPVKGLPMLVEAWKRVRPFGWKMWIVGPDEGGHLAAVQSLVHNAGLEDDFVFTGQLCGAALWRVYDGADLFILPSHTENFSMVVGEALAHGVPAIATHGAPWEVLDREGCGWWVPATVTGLSEALRQATRSPIATLRAMGDVGRCLVRDRFGWRAVAAKFVKFYESCRVVL